MKILIVDDHSLVREGLRAILSRSDLSAQYLEAWDSVSVWDQVTRNPDLDFVLLDIQLTDCNGLQLLTRIVEHRPALPVVMLSADHDSQTVTDALNLGASGFLPKTSLSDVLVSAIRLVLAGGIYVPPAALQSWLLFNPLTIPIEATRSLLIRGQWPSLIPWLVHSLACLITLYAGWWVFQRTRRGFADVI